MHSEVCFRFIFLSLRAVFLCPQGRLKSAHAVHVGPRFGQDSQQQIRSRQWLIFSVQHKANNYYSTTRMSMACNLYGQKIILVAPRGGGGAGGGEQPPDPPVPGSATG